MYIKRIRLSSWYPGTVGILRLEGRDAVRTGHPPLGHGSHCAAAAHAAAAERHHSVIPTAPTADRRPALLEPRCERSLPGLCSFSATPRRNLRAPKRRSSTAASPPVEFQAL